MKPARRGSGKKSASRASRAKKTAARPARAKAPVKSKADDAARQPRNEAGEAALFSAADALFRCAVESCRQHHRLARLIAGGASDPEQRVAWRMAASCDTLLKQVTESYAPAAALSSSNSNVEVRRCGNALWRASRAFTNRFLDKGRFPSDSKREHSSGDFLDLRLRHELDASSILNLKQATEEYRHCRPSAALAIGDGKMDIGD